MLEFQKRGTCLYWRDAIGFEIGGWRAIDGAMRDGMVPSWKELRARRKATMGAWEFLQQDDPKYFDHVRYGRVHDQLLVDYARVVRENWAARLQSAREAFADDDKCGLAVMVEAALFVSRLVFYKALYENFQESGEGMSRLAVQDAVAQTTNLLDTFQVWLAAASLEAVVNRKGQLQMVAHRLERAATDPSAYQALSAVNLAIERIDALSQRVTWLPGMV